MKSGKILAGVCAAALLLAGCQESPKDSLVVHKNMENLISEAQTESEGRKDAETIREEVAGGERYKTEIENESLGVRVTVDAAVEVPDAETLNVYRVKQKPFTQEFVDRAAKELLGGGPYYDAEMLYSATKADIEETIEYYQDVMKEMRVKYADIPLDQITGEPKYTEEEWNAEVERMIAEVQRELDLYQPLYEDAPAKVTLTDYPTDTALKIKGPDDGTLLAGGGYLPEGVEYTALATSPDAPMRALFVANDGEGTGNRLYFTQFFTPGVYPMADFSETELRWNRKESPASLGLPEDAAFTMISAEGLPESMQPLEGDKVTISEAEARAEAEALFDTLGIEDFAFDEGRVASVINEIKGDAEHYRRYWVLKYRRKFDGVLSSAASGVKEDFYSEGDTYVLSVWQPECIEVHVNDGGVAGFAWAAPVEVTETVVENASLKPFSEIRDTFESMICVTNARSKNSGHDRTAIQIDRVRLTYARVSEPENFDTGLMIPVWSFEGVKEDGSSTGEIESTIQSGTLLAINAIDGSVIDSELGY